MLVLSGDHIYKMDYSEMLASHKKRGADCTIAVINVSLEEASRFGIMNTKEDGEIYEFEEKPKKPKSTNASMGIYIFTWEKLRRYLIEDEANKESSNDFGKNIIPAMLGDGCKLYAYNFSGYWKDVGTINSLWEANMDLLDPESGLNLDDDNHKIYARNSAEPPHYTGVDALISNSLVTEGCEIDGQVVHSVISTGAEIFKGAKIEHSIIMPGAKVREGAQVSYAIVGDGADIGAGAKVGAMQDKGEHYAISVVAPNYKVEENAVVEAGVMVE